jgi:hypothetical protein
MRIALALALVLGVAGVAIAQTQHLPRGTDREDTPP